jgi:hypothetical protein
MKKFKEQLTVERARKLFSYDPETGVLTWQVRTSNRIKIGDPAGCIAIHGKEKKRRVLVLRVDGELYLASRIIWLIVTGEWPERLVDHKDRDPINNRWVNLRLATHTQNSGNLLRANRHGLKGISSETIGNYTRYKAEITKHGKRTHLGWFPTPEEAHAAYIGAAIMLFEEFARGE